VKYIKGFFKFLFKFIGVVFILANLIIIFSGRFYLYKGIYHTYLKGRSGPSATEYRIFSNRIITANNPQSLPHHAKYLQKTADTSLINQLRRFDMHAFVVIKNDSLLYESYWDGYSDTSHTNSFSMAKSYVSALLGCALKDKSIKSIDAKVTDYVILSDAQAKQKVNLKHLANMCSGIDFNESYVNPFGYPAEGYYSSDVVSASINTKLKNEPGKYFYYTSGNTALLGKCISEATKMTLSEYCSVALWTPLGCEQNAYWSLDKEGGQEKGFCCVNSNACDFARLGMLYLHKGNWRGKQLIDSSYIEESIVPNGTLNDKNEAQQIYGRGFWLTAYKGQKFFYARGILGQFIICLPQENMVIVKLARKRNPKNSGEDLPAEVPICIDLAKGLL
jgi:CubicO group peptidase (beta-lactamase class C family)